MGSVHRMHLALAAISGDRVISLLISIVVLGLIWYIVTWVIGKIPLPEPARVVIQVVMALILAIFLINALLSINDHGFISW